MRRYNMKKIAIAMMAAAIAFPAQAAERAFSISGFEDVRILGGVNVVIKTDKSVSARAEAENRETLERVKISKSGKQLTVSVQAKPNQTERFTSDGPVTVYLSTDRISSINHSGSGKVSVDGLNDRGAQVRLSGFGTLEVSNVDSEALDIAMQGGGQITLSGKAQKSIIKMLGASIFNGSAFTTEDLELFHRGPASSSLTVEREAMINNSGTGMIEIRGKPDCKVKSDGAAQITCNPERR